jgi:5-methylcytosine-specific restriction endonuclease McrA
MSSFALGHLADHILLQGLKALVRQDHATTAAMLAHLAEVDARRLYARTCASMFDYCVRKLGFSEDVAAKRIHAARTARIHPAIFAAVAEGRLHLAGVQLLAPVLTTDNAAGLLEAAARKSRREIETLLAHRFPRPDVPEQLRPLAPAPARPVALPVAQRSGPALAMLAPSPASSSDVMEQSRSYAPGHVAVVEVASEVEHSQPVAAVTAQVPAPAPCERLAPLSPGRYSFESTFDEEIVDLLDRAKALLGHQLPSRNRTEVLRRVLRDWVQAAERRKFGLTEKPRAARKRPANERTIPNAIKRAVHDRDGGRCAFVGDDGQRCEAQKFLEYDHIVPLARGGLTTASNLRLLCSTHNRLEAERVLGAGFMERRRERARSSTPNRPLRAAGKPGESSPFPGPRAVP